MKRTLITILYSSLIALAVSLFPYQASAEVIIEQIGSDKVFNDFVVGPGKSEVSLQPGTDRVVNITITNRMGTPKTFNLSVEDFTGSQDPSQPVVLLGDARGPYSLRDYIHIEDETFTIEHGQRAVVPVHISVPLDAEPGGLYGAVLVSTASLPHEKKGGTTAIVSRIGSLFFVTVPGEAHKEGSLKEFAIENDQKVFFKGPIEYNILYENKGNIYLNPYGIVRITNMFGQEVGAMEVQPWFALPGSIRLREISWDKPYLFGKYTAELSLNRGYDNVIDTERVTFYVLPLKLMLIVVVSLIVVSSICYWILTRFEFRRKK